jgi:sn-glycerol 3-phosphate transport system ATP-binding protein
MGRAIVRKPAAFLFDEPLSNLDAKLRVSMRGEIKRLQKRLGTTSLYVTHDQLEAMTLADRLVVLNGGRIEQIGRPLDVYHRPASTFVASFIGSPAMNLIKGEIEGGNLQIGLYRIALGDRAPVEGPVTVGLRAEDLKLAGVGEDAMLFQVDYVEELGAQRLVHGTIESQALTIALSPETPLSGDLAVTIAVDRLHFFSTETGKRLERGTSFANEAPVAAPRLETAS